MRHGVASVGYGFPAMGHTAKRQLIEALQRENKTLKAELAVLRVIVTEKFARELEVAAQPDDAAEVLRWATNPGAVRELLKHTPAYAPEDLVCPASECVTEHGRWPHTRQCPIASAWRALGDPRGAADIELAHDQALIEDEIHEIALRQDLTESQRLCLRAAAES